jgi:hypothetical protein
MIGTWASNGFGYGHGSSKHTNTCSPAIRVVQSNSLPSVGMAAHICQSHVGVGQVEFSDWAAKQLQ